ncbi:MAG: hypothetical protein U0694_14315 [Anaerolineae bacterium]
MTLDMLATLRRDEIIADAENFRLAQAVEEPQPPLYAKLLERVGGALTSAGANLSQQAAAAHAAWELKNNCEPRLVR